jgi:hypothetical protein
MSEEKKKRDPAKHPNLFQKGNPGRAKGSRNKVTKEMRRQLQKIFGDAVSFMPDALAALGDPSSPQYNPEAFINAMSKILPYIMTKETSLELNTNGQPVFLAWNIEGVETNTDTNIVEIPTATK